MREQDLATNLPRRVLPPLIFASLVGGAMILGRYAFSGTWRFSGMFGNLILAWIPMVLSMFIHRLAANRAPRLGWLWFLAVCWFLFFPNAFYIVTDLVHYKKFGTDGVPKWFDLLLIMAHAVPGMLLGCVSLLSMELLVDRLRGRRAAHVFAFTMLGLGAFGIYLGRFLRLNSWDLFARPWKFIEKIVLVPERLTEAFTFSAVFFLFSLGVYWTVTTIARAPALPTRPADDSPASGS